MRSHNALENLKIQQMDTTDRGLEQQTEPNIESHNSVHSVSQVVGSMSGVVVSDTYFPEQPKKT